MKPVVFIGHDADRTAASWHLLGLLQWARENRPSTALRVLLLQGGPLLHRYRALAPTDVLHWHQRSEDLGDLALISRQPARRRRLMPLIDDVAVRRLRRRLTALHPSVVYLDGAAALEVWPALPWPGVPRIAHVHELTVGAPGTAVEIGPERLLAADRVFVVSKPVERFVRTLGVPPERVERHPAMTRSGAAPDSSVRPGGPTVIAGCGPVDWRTGPDLFIRLVHQLTRSGAGQDLRFRWLGDTAADARRGRALASESGLDGSIEWCVGPTDERASLDGIDVVVSVGREDVSPVVCLDAAAAGIPFVCFDSSGAADIAHEAAGLVAPYPDVEAMGGLVAELAQSEERRRSVGVRARRVVEAGYLVDRVAPAAWAGIERLAVR